MDNCVKEQNVAPIKSLKISGNCICEYMISCDTSVESVLALAEKLQAEILSNVGVKLEITKASDKAEKKIALVILENTSKPTYTVKTEGDDLLLGGSDAERLSEAVDYIARVYFGKRLCISGYFYKKVDEDVNIENVDVCVKYNRINTLTLCGKDISEFVIVNGAQDEPSAVYAAEELQSFLYKATGVTVAFADESSDKPKIKLVFSEDMQDNYSLKTVNGDLVISGGARGILYGAYKFLEKYVGWEFLPYGTDVLLCEDDSVAIDNIDFDYKQYFEYRSPFFYASLNPTYSAKAMINSKFGKPLGEEHYRKYGGFYGFTGGHVHTLAALLGDASHAASVGKNPCIYEETNYKTVEGNLFKMLEANPDAQIISVSATDSAKFCDCDDCTGKSIGGNATDAYIKFVNRLAEAVEKDYPNVKLHMLGYGHTFTPPVHVMPKDNVIVQLANMGCCFQHPLESKCCKRSAEFMHHIEKWEKVTKNLYLWDYATDFLVFMATFPNFDVLRDNIRMFYEHNVKGVFEQGDLNNYYAKYEDLETHIIAKLLENPYMSEEEYEEHINKFMRGYYGPGWKHMRDYFDFLRESSRKVGHYSIYAQPDYMYDKQDFIDRYAEIDGWFEAAEAMTTNDRELYHVRCVHISYSYMKLFMIYNHVMEDGTDEEVAAVREECGNTFDDIVREGYRLVDVHPALATFVGQVERVGHPRRWCVGKNRWNLMGGNGMAKGATGEMYKED